jgi:hypothetical protein
MRFLSKIDKKIREDRMKRIEIRDDLKIKVLEY